MPKRRFSDNLTLFYVIPEAEGPGSVNQVWLYFVIYAGDGTYRLLMYDQWDIKGIYISSLPLPINIYGIICSLSIGLVVVYVPQVRTTYLPCVSFALVKIPCTDFNPPARIIKAANKYV